MVPPGPLVAACTLVLAVGVTTTARAAPAWGVRLETGAEYDTNAARAETLNGEPTGPIVASPAGRFAASGDLGLRLHQRLAWTLAGSGAGRAFVRDIARNEDVAVASASTQLLWWMADTLSLSLSGGYYDAFQRRTRGARDFRSVAPSARLDWVVGPGRVFAGAGYRWFTFKPQRDFDFAGPNALLGFRVSLSEEEDDGSAVDWDVSAFTTAETRAFTGPACPNVDACPPPVDQPRERRHDQFFTSQAEVTRTGDFLLGLGVAAHVNVSNSFGESLKRYIGFVRGSFLLPWDLSFTTRVDVLLSRYDDGLPLSRDLVTGRLLVSVEEEGRSTMRLELVRPLGERLELGARYTLFTSAPTGGPARYVRHLFFLSIAATWN